MPEGPTIVILKEAVQPFKGKKILSASGTAGIPVKSLVKKRSLILNHGVSILLYVWGASASAFIC